MKKKRRTPHKHLLKKLRAYTDNDQWSDLAYYLGVGNSVVSMWLKRNKFPHKYWDEAFILSNGEITKDDWRGLR